jgi:hypothetical protein
MLTEKVFAVKFDQQDRQFSIAQKCWLNTRRPMNAEINKEDAYISYFSIQYLLIILNDKSFTT